MSRCGRGVASQVSTRRLGNWRRMRTLTCFMPHQRRALPKPTITKPSINPTFNWASSAVFVYLGKTSSRVSLFRLSISIRNKAVNPTLAVTLMYAYFIEKLRNKFLSFLSTWKISHRFTFYILNCLNSYSSLRHRIKENKNLLFFNKAAKSQKKTNIKIQNTFSYVKWETLGTHDWNPHRGLIYVLIADLNGARIAPADPTAHFWLIKNEHQIMFQYWFAKNSSLWCLVWINYGNGVWNPEFVSEWNVMWI